MTITCACSSFVMDEIEISEGSCFNNSYEYVEISHAVALSSGTMALHLDAKMAGEKLNDQVCPNHGTLQRHRIFCSDASFDASIHPVVCGNGEVA